MRKHYAFLSIALYQDGLKSIALYKNGLKRLKYFLFLQNCIQFIVKTIYVYVATFQERLHMDNIILLLKRDSSARIS